MVATSQPLATRAGLRALERGGTAADAALAAAAVRQRVGSPPGFAPVPRVGELVRRPELAATLRAIADRGPDALYTGRVAEAIAAACWVAEEDLAAYEARWVEPLRLDYRGT